MTSQNPETLFACGFDVAAGIKDAFVYLTRPGHLTVDALQRTEAHGAPAGADVVLPR